LWQRFDLRGARYGPGGQALIIDLKRAVDSMNAGTVNGIIAKLTFRFMLLKRSYKKNEFEKMIAGTKFDDVEIRENLHRPGDCDAKIVRRHEVAP
jgi:hypothetical protein